MENKLILDSILTHELVEATSFNILIEFIYRDEEYSANVIVDTNGVPCSDLHIKRINDELDVSDNNDLIQIVLYYINSSEYGTILEEYFKN